MEFPARIYSIPYLRFWRIMDEAPEEGYATPTLYIKPSFMERMKSSSFIFLSNFNGKKADATLN